MSVWIGFRVAVSFDNKAILVVILRSPKCGARTVSVAA